MNPAEYDLMASVEPHHWWYAGLRDAFGQVLRRIDPLQRLVGGRFLDAGCGTGQNLRWLSRNLKATSLTGFDRAAAAVEIAAKCVPEAHIYEDDLCNPDPPDGPFDLILCSDVLYATGIEPALAGMRRLCERLASGGLFLLHLPAFNWLYSRHDVAVHTKHRFCQAEVISLLDQLDLAIELITYRMFMLFPLVVLSRVPSLLFRSRSTSAGDVMSDLWLPILPLNALLRTVVKFENRAIGFGVRFPWGSSLIAVGRKL
jgi:SAM-dependent methyltransferase